MKYAPKTIKKVLKRCIKEMSLHPEQYCVNPGKDFTRVRKLSFAHVLEAVLSMSGITLRVELMEHFNLSPSMPTVSAFVQQKNNVDRRAFEALFLTFTNAVTNSIYSKAIVCFPLAARIFIHIPIERKKERFMKPLMDKSHIIISI